MYTVHYGARFEKQYVELSRESRERVDKAIELLHTNPHHPSLRTHKRKGEREIWQARVTRSLRLYFELQGSTITVISVVAHEK